LMGPARVQISVVSSSMERMDTSLWPGGTEYAYSIRKKLLGHSFYLSPISIERTMRYP
jgi:hypothetical protein